MLPIGIYSTTDKFGGALAIIVFVVVAVVLFILLCNRLFQPQLKKKYELASRVLMFLMYEPGIRTVRMCCAESGFISESPYISVMMKPQNATIELSSVKIHSTGVFTVSTKMYGDDELDVEIRDNTGEVLLLQCTVTAVCDLVVKLYEICRHESLHKYYEFRWSLDSIGPDTLPIYYPAINCTERV